jgi:hypothetical protein
VETVTSTDNSWHGWIPKSVVPTAILIIAIAAVAAPATPAGPTATEFEVKAAYLYNFGRFITWPASSPPTDAFTICVLGRDPFGDVLDNLLKGEKIQGKPLLARRIGSAEDASSCRVVYISASEQKRLRPILAGLQKNSALTVSDIPGFVNAGGIIEFVSDGGRIRFQVNLAAAQRQGLSLSSELLKVATSVKGAVGSGQ